MRRTELELFKRRTNLGVGKQNVAITKSGTGRGQICTQWRNASNSTCNVPPNLRTDIQASGPRSARSSTAGTSQAQTLRWSGPSSFFLFRFPLFPPFLLLYRQPSLMTSWQKTLMSPSSGQNLDRKVQLPFVNHMLILFFLFFPPLNSAQQIELVLPEI